MWCCEERPFHRSFRYTIVPGSGRASDGYGYLTIPLPHQRHITVARTLDFERSPVLVINVQAAVSLRDNEKIIVNINIFWNNSY